MALRGASTTVDIDWLDFKALAQESAAVVITTRALEPATDYGNGEIEPVIADVIVLTGSRAGEYFPRERILAAGIRPKIQTVGDSVVGRVRPYGKRGHPGLESEETGDIELAERALAKFGSSSNGSGSESAASTKKKAAAAVADSEDPPF